MGELLKDHLQATYSTHSSGKAKFGFDSGEVIVLLSLMNHPSNYIMLLGRWMPSKVFLDYIQPQVLKWTNNIMKRMDMTTHEDSFTSARLTKPPPTKSLICTQIGSMALMLPWHSHDCTSFTEGMLLLPTL
jgi:hypothetical protein